MISHVVILGIYFLPPKENISASATGHTGLHHKVHKAHQYQAA